MKTKPELLAVVALLKNLPEHGLVIGNVGTVVEVLDEDTYLIEFCNNKGETLSMTPVSRNDMLPLYYDRIAA
jgi:hypothetical protein